MSNKSGWKGAIKLVEELGNVLVGLIKWQPGTHGRAKEVAAASARVSKVLQVISEYSPLLALGGNPPALAQACLKLNVPANLLKLVLWMLPVASPAGSHAQEDRLPLNLAQISETWELALRMLWMLTSTVDYSTSQSKALIAQFVASSEDGAPGEIHHVIRAMVNILACCENYS